MAESKPVDDSSAFRRRLQIYSVGWLQVVALKTVRSSLSSMVPIIVATSGLKAAEEAMLLSAFFPGYALSQALLGGVVQVYGSKLVLGAKKATTLQTKELWCARQNITMPKGEHLRARDYDNRADDDETRGRV
jgi:hypothetical protein